MPYLKDNPNKGKSNIEANIKHVRSRLYTPLAANAKHILDEILSSATNRHNTASAGKNKRDAPYDNQTMEKHMLINKGGGAADQGAGVTTKSIRLGASPQKVVKEILTSLSRCSSSARIL